MLNAQRLRSASRNFLRLRQNALCARISPLADSRAFTLPVFISDPHQNRAFDKGYKTTDGIKKRKGKGKGKEKKRERKKNGKERRKKRKKEGKRKEKGRKMQEKGRKKKQ